MDLETHELQLRSLGENDATPRRGPLFGTADCQETARGGGARGVNGVAYMPYMECIGT